jgi:AmmeMemoRadiSam system protein B/AmmeMemoRadiSam system protein A
MRNLRFGIVALSVMAGLLVVVEASRGGGEAPRIRPMAVAGSFYPADPKELAATIDGFLAKAAPPPLENLVALVSPHAGYQYSGPVAAYSYALLKGRKYDRVVVIAPSHYEAFGFSSVYDGAAYTTPFGQVPVDQAFAKKLAGMSSLIRLSPTGHTPSADKPEHSIEVQLPFLQRVLGPFQLVPVIMGDQSYDACRALGVALAKLVAGTNTLILASSDLSHYHTYDQAVTEDHKTLKAIGEYDYFDLSRNLDLRVWEACGGGPIVAAMIAAERLGATEAKVLHYANTGDVTGDHSRVVGYGAVALVKGAGAGKLAEAPFALSTREKDALLKIARTSVETSVRTGKPYEASTGGLETLAQERGAFVTLTKNGQLRGCIGYVAPLKPLYIAVRDVAQMAALRDTRFRPVTAAELGDLQYEISVLSPLRRVADVQAIRLGVDGVLLHTSGNEGLFLPQVATEEGWDRATLLEQLCSKAGLPAGSWKSAGADLFRFTALVFGEHGPAAALIPLELSRNPRAWLAPPAPDTPSPRAAPF